MLFAVLREAGPELIHSLEVAPVEGQRVRRLNIVLREHLSPLVIITEAIVGEVEIILIYLLTEYITRQQRLLLVLTMEVSAPELPLIETWFAPSSDILRSQSPIVVTEQLDIV